MRQSTLAYLKDLSDDERQTISNKLRDQLLATDMWREANSIGITISQKFEWDTRSIIEKGWEQGKTVCVPKCIPQEKKLLFYRLLDFQQLEVVYYGLLEPKPEETEQIEKSDIDLLIVPGIVFDHRGFRIGFGGGYYDRFLADFQNETVSLVHTSQLLEQVPAQPFDIPVKHLITENGLLSKQ